MRKQEGQIIRIGERWYVRYWERRNVGGTIERKRASHSIGLVTTRGKRPPADIKKLAEDHMCSVNNCVISAERMVSLPEFIETVYLPWAKKYKRPSTYRSYEGLWQNHLKPVIGSVRSLLKDVRTFDC